MSSSPDPLNGSDGRSKNGVPGKWDGKMDSLRGWIIAFCWLVAAGVECVGPSLQFGQRTDVPLHINVTAPRIFIHLSDVPDSYSISC